MSMAFITVKEPSNILMMKDGAHQAIDKEDITFLI